MSTELQPKCDDCGKPSIMCAPHARGVMTTDDKLPLRPTRAQLKAVTWRPFMQCLNCRKARKKRKKNRRST